MSHQILYNRVRLLGEGPSLRNIARLDHGALPMLHAMAQRGIQVDLSHFAHMETVLKQDLERIMEEIHAIAGHYINLASGPQVSDFLFKQLGLKQARVKFTKSGDRESVESEVLLAIQHLHPAVAKILEFKRIDKLRGTYVIPIPKLARRTAFGTWRLYPNFTTTRVPTGRFSAKDPNLLAMPNRTKRGRQLCEGFITDPGWCLLSVDESQIEPRTVAHRSQDAALMSVYQLRQDIYSDFATEAFQLKDERYQDATGKWKYPTVDGKEHRFPAKTCVLASIYRVTNKGLVEQMPVLCRHCKVDAADHLDEDCPLGFEAQWNEDNCQDLINAFYLRYPGISTMQREDDTRARKYGYVWDDLGRLQHTLGVKSVHPWIVSATLREAGNMPIQGFACGTLKLTMAAIHDDLVASKMLGAVFWPLLPVHDEILGEVREDVAAEVGEHIAYRFKTCVQLRVPLGAEWTTAPSWGKISK